jgi:putative peptidoglycan lipid II flippase
MTDARARLRKSLIQSAGLIGFLTLLSRVAGMARDVVSAGVFGTSRVWDAFLVAFTIPNFLRRVVGEGALSNAFIPVYTEVLKQGGREEAEKLAGVVWTLLTCVLGAIVLIIVALIHAGLALFEFPEKVRLTLKLLSILFPYILFLAHVALSMGILNCHKHFFMPSFAPVLLNIFWITGVLFLCPTAETLEGKAFLLAGTVLAAGLVQLLVQGFPLARLGLKLRVAFDFRHPALGKIHRLILPAVMAFAVTQISILIDMGLAFFLGDGANSSLWYGNRLMQFPLGLFGIAMGTALLPTFSDQAAAKDHGEIRETLAFSLKTIFLVVLPASCGLIFLAKPIVQVLFERGNFDAVSTYRTARVLMYYSIGLFAYSGQKVLTSAFYAVQDSRTPFIVSSVTVLVDVVLNLILMGPLREAGLALATSLAGILNFGLLLFLFEREVHSVPLSSLLVSFAKILLASLFTGFAALWIHAHLHFSFASSLANAGLALFLSILISTSLYAGLSLVFRFEESRGLLRLFLPRRA